MSRLLTSNKDNDIPTTLFTNNASYHYSCTLDCNEEAYERRRNETDQSGVKKMEKSHNVQLGKVRNIT